MESLERLLAEHPFFQGLDPSHLRLLVSCAGNVRFNAGQFLFRQQEEANFFYLIRDGKVAVEIHAPERGAIVLQTIDPGEIVGWSWLVPPYRWRFDARAAELTRALALDGKCLRDKCERDHDLGYELLQRFTSVIAQRLEAARLQLMNLYGPRE
jgi:CRP-like cAMP-binding protein